MNIDEFLKIYGLKKDDFRDYVIYRFGKDFWMTTKESYDFNKLRVNRKGIRIARQFSRGIKPTTTFVQLFGEKIKKNVVFIKKEDLKEFINGGTVPAQGNPEYRFVVVKCNGFTIGVGLYKEGEVKSQIPRARRIVDQNLMD